MKQQADNFLNHVSSSGLKAEIVMRDREGMFSKDFDSTLKAADIKVQRTSIRAPNMNAFVERWIQSIKHECLNWFVVFGEQHFNYLISQYVAYYHEERPHQSLSNEPLAGKQMAPVDELPQPDQIECHQRLGGVLKHYYRKAA